MSSAQVRRELAAAVEAGDRRTTTVATMQLLRMGASLAPDSVARVLPLLDPEFLPRDWQQTSGLAEAVTFNARNNGREQDESQSFADVPAAYRLIEGIAWDAPTSRLFVGSVLDRRLLVREGENWRRIPLAQPIGGIFGMAVDGRRRLLWFASAAAEPMAHPETAFSGLVAIDLDRLREVRRVPVPDARLGDVAVARDGTVFASDGRSGALYRCRPGRRSAEVMIPPGLFRSPQGMAVSRGGGTLYVADYAQGLFRVELDSLHVFPMIVRTPTMLDGIDGLVQAGGMLVAIQNGTRPRRIIRLALDRTGRIIQYLSVAEQNVAAWGEPTLGTIAGDRLLYIADGQWELYGSGEATARGQAPRPTPIRAVDAYDSIIIAD